MHKFLFVLLLFVFFGFGQTQAQSTSGKIPKLPWNEEQYLIHMNNHINNNVIMFDEMFDNYLEHGIPANKAEKLPAVTAKQLRKDLDIPEAVWKDPKLKSQLRTHLRKFMTLHDASKVNTSTKFLLQQNEYLAPAERFVDSTGKRTKNRLVVEGLTDIFGKKIDQTTNNPGKITIDLQNRIDDHVAQKYLNNVDHLDERLRGPWVKKLGLRLELIVDKTERWGNPVSKVEFNKPKMTRGSRFTYVQGKEIPRADVEIRRPEIMMQYHLEENYSKLANSYEDADRSFKSFFKSLKNIGVDHTKLDPIRKYELIPLVQNGDRSINLPAPSQTRKVLLLQNYDELEDIISSSPKAKQSMLEATKRQKAKLAKYSTQKETKLNLKRPKTLAVPAMIKCFEVNLLKSMGGI